MTTVLMLLILPISFLNLTHNNGSMDYVNSLLIAVAVTAFTVRHRIRKKDESKNEKTLSI